jgi:hypothetical protein
VVRTTEIASVYRRRAQALRASLYLSPPVADVGIFAFADLDQLARIGRESTRQAIAAWWVEEQSRAGRE